MKNNFQKQVRYFTLNRRYNLIGCAVSVIIFIDGIERGRIRVNETIKIPISAEAHEVVFRNSNALFAQNSLKYQIPSGNEDVVGEVAPSKKNGWVLTMYKNNGVINKKQADADLNAFCTSVISFIVELFQQQDTRDILQHSNNRRGDLTLRVTNKGITLSYMVNNPKGFEQWSTGEEKFRNYSYAQIGISELTNVSSEFYRQLTVQIESAVMNYKGSEWKKNKFGSWYI